MSAEVPRYTARQLPRAGYEGDYTWGPYDEQRKRWIRQAVFTKADAQQIADRMNAAGVDWTYGDENS